MIIFPPDTLDYENTTRIKLNADYKTVYISNFSVERENVNSAGIIKVELNQTQFANLFYNFYLHCVLKPTYKRLINLFKSDYKKPRRLRNAVEKMLIKDGFLEKNIIDMKISTYIPIEDYKYVYVNDEIYEIVLDVKKRFNSEIKFILTLFKS